MRQGNEKISMTVVALLALFVVAGAVGQVFAAAKVTSCTVSFTSQDGEVQVPAAASTVVKVFVTYQSFGSSDWPMMVTVTPISAGFTSNSSVLSGSVSGTLIFSLKITNTDPNHSSGAGTVSVTWATGSSSACGPVGMQTFGTPQPCKLNSCFTSGGATEGSQSGVQGISVSYTSSEFFTDTETVYVVVTNHAGQTVFIQNLASSFSALGTKPFFFALTGFQPGTYSASSFVVNAQGVVVSRIFSVAFTL